MMSGDLMFRGPAVFSQCCIAAVLTPLLLWCSACDPLLLALAAVLSAGLWQQALPELLRCCHERRPPALQILSLARLRLLSMGQAGQDSTAALYLGTGFIWQGIHARQLQERIARGLRTSRGHGSRGGCPELHALAWANHQALRLPLHTLTGHSIVFGTTGSGKTTLLSLLICQAVLRGDTVIVLDPKGDRSLYGKLAAAARHCGRGSEIVHLDVLCRSSDHFNPLSCFSDASEIGARLSQLLPQSGSAQAFRAYTELAITGSVSLLILLQRSVDLRSILQVIQEHQLFKTTALGWLHTHLQRLGNDQANAYFQRMGGPAASGGGSTPRRESHAPSVLQIRAFCAWLQEQGLLTPNPELDNVLTIAAMDGSFYQKVTASALPLLNALCSSTLEELLCGTQPTVSFWEIIGQGHIFYAALHCLQNPGVGARLGKIMLSDLAACAGRLYASAPQPGSRRVCVFIDEASELANESLIQLLNKSRGVNFALTLATQTYADLVQRTGSADCALQILGNCNTLYALRCPDAATSMHIEQHLQQTCCGVRGSTIALSSDPQPGLRSAISRELRLKDCPLFPASAIRLLPNLEFICQCSDGTLLKGLLPILEAEHVQ